ncbi:GGDEF domain-containing protein, partial [Candidatus Woesearchaeota archaeon]|nr:GGDEF domain-containing protein [Candidatus Woesearchaeota archaeon]
ERQSRLEELCKKHDVDFNSLPAEFLEEISRNYSPQTETPQIEHPVLRSILEHHGIDPNTNPEAYKKIDKTMQAHERMLQSQAKAFANKLKEESYDELTGCYIRKKLGGLLYPHIELSREKGHDLSVIMLDIDHFKPYNDIYGHLQGDLTLQTVGNIIRNIIKSPNAAVRYGGEEFYIILPETDAEEAQKIAEKIRSTVEKNIFKKHPALEEMEFGNDNYRHVTVTAGVFTYHPGLDSVLGFYEADQKPQRERGFYLVDKLINVPDQALKNAKNRDQRNQVHIAKID